jgi:hypothetical protein
MAVFSDELVAYAHEYDEFDMKQVLVKADNLMPACFMTKDFST